MVERVDLCNLNNWAHLLSRWIWGICPLTSSKYLWYILSHKDVDGEEYTSAVIGQRVGRQVLRVRSNRRSGMVPRVARENANLAKVPRFAFRKAE